MVGREDVGLRKHVYQSGTRAPKAEGLATDLRVGTGVKQSRDEHLFLMVEEGLFDCGVMGA